MPELPDLITTPEVAQLLRVSVRTVHRMADDGRLPVATKLSGPKGPWLFDRAEVERLAQAGVS